MRQTKRHHLAVGADRPAQYSGDGSATPENELEAPLTNLAMLKTVISSHTTLLARVRRRNDHLRNDNARMELELAGQARQFSASDEAASSKSDPAPVVDSLDRLRWIDEYLHGTLAQTLWALDVRAARLEGHVAVSDRQEARRVLELTHTAYDQLRSLITVLRETADD